MDLLPVYLVCVLACVCSSQQLCNNSYGTEIIDFDEEYLSAVVKNCTVGMTVEFNDGTGSEECQNFFKLFDQKNYYFKSWDPDLTIVKNPSVTLIFDEPVNISSLRMIDTHYSPEDPRDLDVETFITFTPNTDKIRLTWSKSGKVTDSSSNYFHVLHFRTVETKNITIEFITEKNKVKLAYFEVNQLKEIVRSNRLDLAQANVSCSSNEVDCSRTYNGRYEEDLNQSWEADDTEHRPSIEIELGQTYQLELARIFLSNLCRNIVMNVKVFCNGKEWIFGHKNFSTSDLSFIVFPMYSLETDSFTVQFDCYRGNGLAATIKVVEMEFYGSPVSPPRPSTEVMTTPTTPTWTVQHHRMSALERDQIFVIKKRDADSGNDQQEGTTTPLTSTTDETNQTSDSCMDVPIDTNQYVCRASCNTSTVNGKDEFIWKVRIRLCPWESVLYVKKWFQEVHRDITTQCQEDGSNQFNRTAWHEPGHSDISEDNNSSTNSCQLQTPTTCLDIQQLIIDFVNRSFSCNISQWTVNVTFDITGNECKLGSRYKVIWKYDGKGFTSLTIKLPQQIDNETPEPENTTDGTISLPITKTTQPSMSTTSGSLSETTSTNTGGGPVTTTPTTTDDSTTPTFPPAAQSIGCELKVTSEDYADALGDTSSDAYMEKKNQYRDILTEAFVSVIPSTSQIYNMTFKKGSIATSYVADTTQQVTLDDSLKTDLGQSIVDTFNKHNITVDPTSLNFRDLFGIPTVAPTTKGTSNNEVLAGVLGAVSTLLIISMVIAGVTVRMCMKSQRHHDDRRSSRDHELNDNNNNPPSYQFPMFSSSQASSNLSYPAFFSSSVRNQQVSNYQRRQSSQPDAMFDFPTPFQHQQRTSSFGRERAPSRKHEDRNHPSSEYMENPGSNDPRLKQQHMKRRKSQSQQDYNLERTDKTSLTGYTPRRTEVPDQRPSRNIFDRAAATQTDDEAYYSSDINFQHDGLHRNNSLRLHRKQYHQNQHNRGYDNSYDDDAEQEEEDQESQFHRRPSSRRPETTMGQQRSAHSSLDKHHPQQQQQHQNSFYDGSGYQSPEHAHYHRDSLRIQGRRLQRNISHDSDQTTSSYHHRTPHAHGHDYNHGDMDHDALRPYYMVENNNKQKGFFGRLSKKLSAPRVKQSGQNVHRQKPAYERDHKFSIA